MQIGHPNTAKTCSVPVFFAETSFYRSKINNDWINSGSEIQMGQKNSNSDVL